MGRRSRKRRNKQRKQQQEYYYYSQPQQQKPAAIQVIEMNAQTQTLQTKPPAPPPPPPPRTEHLVIHDKRVWKRVNVLGLINAYVEMPTVEAIPTFEWTGPKIPQALWRQILSFFKWTNTTHHCESQVRLFLNPTTGEWKVWAFPQERSGMTSREIAGVEADNQRAAEVGAGYHEFGSVHHHCSASAFQSGTDHTDESGRPGIHLTVGNMDAARHTLHSRATLIHNGSKVMYKNMNLDEWFETPDWLATLSQQVRDVLPADTLDKVMEKVLTTPANDPFPEQWKANMIEPPRSKWDYEGGGLGGTKVNGHTWYPGATTGISWNPSLVDKHKFLDGIADIADENNLSADEMQYLMPVLKAVHDLVLRAPGVNWSDVQPIMDTMGDELEKKIDERGAIGELAQEQKQIGFTGGGKPTQQAGGEEWDAQGYTQ